MDRSHAIDRSEAKFPMQCHVVGSSHLSGSSGSNEERRGEERRGIDGQLVDEIHTRSCRLQYRQLHYLRYLKVPYY